MRVLYLCDRLGVRGGADRHLLAILAAWQGGEVEPFLGVGFDDATIPENERARLPSWQRIKGLDRSGLSAAGGQAARLRLARAVETFQPDLIHLQNVMDPELIDLAGSLAPSLATVQDHRVFCPGLGKVTPAGAACSQTMGPACLACFGDRDYGSRLLGLTRSRLEALAGLRALVALSHYMKNELVAAGASAGSIVVIPPFVQGIGGRERPGPGRYHLLACRLVKRKGVLVAMSAAASLKESARLRVAGGGSLAPEVAASPAADFVGWADREEMDRLLAGAVSLWLPSLWAEPFGIVGLEAMAAGVPVLATDVGGVREWLAPGTSGHLLPPGDAAALAKAADSLAANPDLARAMGAAGRQRVLGHFNREGLMARLLALYRRVAGTAGAVSGAPRA